MLKSIAKKIFRKLTKKGAKNDSDLKFDDILKELKEIIAEKKELAKAAKKELNRKQGNTTVNSNDNTALNNRLDAIDNKLEALKVPQQTKVAADSSKTLKQAAAENKGIRQSKELQPKRGQFKLKQA
ncbi:hypothetical protein FGM00_11235 [Aggregatimonas sangjinii]|uniref:Uncharacterized protein n=1 Tax=Aggregatimonas sangjinii TaxID=2583587 RepID=A0A5B7SUY9_9FLAO|nr:hypothetical protein [Aggregatimonas sangjinii]QCX00650.1 hypothetical protein FGM00_11235 [Aggregatimonas sangjinii]